MTDRQSVFDVLTNDFRRIYEFIRDGGEIPPSIFRVLVEMNERHIAMGTDLTKITASVATIEAKVDAVVTRFGVLQTELNSTDDAAAIAALQARLDASEAKLNALLPVEDDPSDESDTEQEAPANRAAVDPIGG